MGTRLIEERQRGADMDRLTTQQRMFVLEMLADKGMNPTNAAKKAGYKNPPQAANGLMKKPAIKALLGKETRERRERVMIEADQVLEQLAFNAFRNIKDIINDDGYIDLTDIKSWPDSITSCIEAIEFNTYYDDDGKISKVVGKIKWMPKLGTLELIMKHLGMLAPTEHEHKHSINWDELYSDESRVTPNSIEERLAEYTKEDGS